MADSIPQSYIQLRYADGETREFGQKLRDVEPTHVMFKGYVFNLMGRGGAMIDRERIELRELLCQKCGRDYPVWFAPNALWNRVVKEDEHFLCMDCFALLAEERGVTKSAWMLTEENVELSQALEKLRTVESQRYELLTALEAAIDYFTASADEETPTLGEILEFAKKTVREVRAALAPQEAPQLDDNRCAVCGWTMAESTAKGCVRGNCSLRPLPINWYDPARAEREGYKIVSSRVEEAPPQVKP